MYRVVMSFAAALGVVACTTVYESHSLLDPADPNRSALGMSYSLPKSFVYVKLLVDGTKARYAVCVSKEVAAPDPEHQYVMAHRNSVFSADDLKITKHKEKNFLTKIQIKAIDQTDTFVVNIAKSLGSLRGAGLLESGQFGGISCDSTSATVLANVTMDPSDEHDVATKQKSINHVMMRHARYMARKCDVESTGRDVSGWQSPQDLAEKRARANSINVAAAKKESEAAQRAKVLTLKAQKAANDVLQIAIDKIATAKDSKNLQDANAALTIAKSIAQDAAVAAQTATQAAETAHTNWVAAKKAEVTARKNAAKPPVLTAAGNACEEYQRLRNNHGPRNPPVRMLWKRPVIDVPVAPADCSVGFCYRHNLPYRFEMAVAGNSIVSGVFYMPNDSPLVAMDLTRGVAITKTTNITFDANTGQITEVTLKKGTQNGADGAEAVELALLPAAAVGAFFEAFSQTAGNMATAISSETTRIENEIARHEARQRLTRSGLALESGNVDSGRSNWPVKATNSVEVADQRASQFKVVKKEVSSLQPTEAARRAATTDQGNSVGQTGQPAQQPVQGQLPAINPSVPDNPFKPGAPLHNPFKPAGNSGVPKTNPFLPPGKKG